MLKDNASVLILDGEGDLALFAARCLGQIPGWKVHILSTVKNPPVRFSKFHASFEHIQPRTSQERLEFIARAMKRTGADIMFPVSEAIRFATAHFQEISQLGRITLLSDQATFETAVDKGKLARFLMAHKLPLPATVFYTGEPLTADQLATLSFPVLLKPIDGADGLDIEKFQTVDELSSRLAALDGDSRRYFIQSFIHGHDISCGVLCRDGNLLAHTIQEGVIQRRRAFASPAGIKYVNSNETLDILQKLMRALKWNGIANVDMRYDERDHTIKVLEINPRFWGSLQGALCAGVNFPWLACLAGMGVDFAYPSYQSKYYVAGKVALQKLLEQYIGRGSIPFSFGETSWQFALHDPFAEIRKMSRAFLT